MTVKSFWSNPYETRVKTLIRSANDSEVTLEATIFFAFSGGQESISPLLANFSDEANRIIAADLEIRTGFDDEANERRYWEIEGFSRVSCGGTHVRRTGEIGPIRLKRNNIGRGKERVEIYLES